MSRDWNSIMFDNIGGKIQKVAKAIAWFYIVLSIVGGAIMFLYALTDLEYLWHWMLLAPIIVIFGCIAAWLSVIALYGLGVLIEDTHAIRTTNAAFLKNIDVKLDFLARPAIREAEEKARQEWEERIKQKAEERAKQEAMRKAETGVSPVEIKQEASETTWICPKCNRKNLAVRNDCWSCGTPKQ